MITLEQVKTHGEKWFNTVMQGGSAVEQAAYFVNQNPLIYVVPSGVTFTMQQHFELHQKFTDERHGFGDFTLTHLNDSPARVRATGTVYWQAEIVNQGAPNIIKAIVGEDWLIEKLPGGDLKFVLYMNTFHHALPGSAAIIL